MASGGGPTADRTGRGGRPDGRRLRDLAVLLPLALLAMLLPPYIQIFDQASFPAGIPLLHLYIFGLWALAILAAGLLARRLRATEMDGDPADRQADAGQPGDGAGTAPPDRTG